MNDAIADLHFLVLAHERLAQIGIVSVADGGAANEGRPVRNGLVALRRGQIFAGWKHRSSRTDRTDRRHINMFCGKSDERAG